MDWGALDWGGIGIGLVGLLFGVYQGLKALASDQKQQREENEKQRKLAQGQLRRAFQFGDLVDAQFSRIGMQARRHNATEHPLGEGQFLVEELPDEIAGGIRAYVESGGGDE